MRGRPRSMIASRAARMVRPEYRTSSISTTTLLSMPVRGKLGGVRRAHGLVGEIVAEHGHIQLADDRGGVHGGIGGGNLGGEPDGEGVAPPRDAQQDQVLGALVGLEDLMGDTSECTVDVRLVEYHSGEYNLGRNRCFWNRSQRSSPLSPPHGTELKKDCLPSQITTAALTPRRCRHAFNLTRT